MLEFHFGGKIRAWKPQMLPIPNMVTTGTAVRHYVCIEREKDKFLRLFRKRQFSETFLFRGLFIELLIKYISH